MQWLITITAYGDRDPSCNLYTLTETHNLGEVRPSPETIKALVEEVKERYKASWPHRGVNMRGLIPIDVDILDVTTVEVNAES
jgi:hypothetical protein